MLRELTPSISILTTCQKRHGSFGVVIGTFTIHKSVHNLYRDQTLGLTTHFFENVFVSSLSGFCNASTDAGS